MNENSLQDPTNQVFLDKTQCVPSLVSPPIRKTYYPDGPHDQGQSSLGKRKERLQDPSIDLETVSLTRDQLAKASVIGQLDRKFIVCIVPASTESECLIVFDQHAVDERIRVERFLHELCQGFANGDIELHDLGEDPHHLLLSSGEAESLYNHAQYITIFQRWGIHIALEHAELAHPDPETGLHQIQVTAVPAILSKRLAGNSAKEVKQIVTTYLEFLEQQGLKAVTALAQRLKKGGTDLDETALMRWMPASILDLVNSRACRGGSVVACNYSAESDYFLADIFLIDGVTVGFLRCHHVQRRAHTSPVSTAHSTSVELLSSIYLRSRKTIRHADGRL